MVLFKCSLVDNKNERGRYRNMHNKEVIPEQPPKYSGITNIILTSNNHKSDI